MCVDLVVVWSALVALSLPTLSTADPLYVMTAPNLLRVGTTERVFVEAQDYRGPSLDVFLEATSFPGRQQVGSATVTLTSEEKFQKIANIHIAPGYFAENPAVKHVYLRATFQQGANKVSELEKVVLLSFQSGFIFIQTDKTIYTPKNTVLYRVFALSPEFKPTRSSVQVDILNAHGIMMREPTVVSPDNGVITGDFKIPELVSYGTWSIVARFTQTPKKNFTAEFEVKEYVLPTFEISLTPVKTFYYVNDPDLKVAISAWYLYGKEVTGVGFVMFGVIHNGEKRTLPQSLQRVDIQQGNGEATLKREHIIDVFPNMADIVKSSIYVHVSVLTDTGSEMVEAERRGILIVTSPYTIHFKRTPKYFKPGMPFDVTLFISNPDGSPAERIPVVVTAEGPPTETMSSNSGIAKLSVNTRLGISSFKITAETKAPGLTADRQALQTMTAHAYKPKAGSQNYLHIDTNAVQLTIGDQLKINLNPKGSSINVDATYLVLSKGQIVKAKRIQIQGQNLLSDYITVTKDMVPSFRIVAYFHVGSEVVSDSVWVDVKDTCMGELKVEPSHPKAVYSPRQSFNLKITGDPGARVGLVAVDKGVYVLNNKHRLTQTKIWDIVEKMDFACTAGSGQDGMGVFHDAGLLMMTSSAGETDTRTEPTCPTVASRRRRAATIKDVQTTAARNYTGEERQCCVDGMKKSILGYTCERRAEFILDGKSCVDAFLHCCRVMSSYREEDKEEYLELARSDLSEEDEEDLDEFMENMSCRSKFPESWLWNDLSLPTCPGGGVDWLVIFVFLKPYIYCCCCLLRVSCSVTSDDRSAALPDSITSWQFTAISISENKGICVADTLSLEVKKDFFIDLKLPYSVVRHEQIEIRAILHNNHDEQLKQVRVDLFATEDVCSQATKQGKYRTTVTVDAMSTRAVSFVIVPMGVPGKYTIKMKAAAMMGDMMVGDGVEKQLLVVSQGVPMNRTEVIELDPSKYGGMQTRSLLARDFDNRIPDTDSRTYITVQGEEMGIMLQEAIRGDSLATLIRKPGGCGEQNMFGITMPVTAAYYLDKTNQWHTVGVDQRALAQQYIEHGKLACLFIGIAMCRTSALRDIFMTRPSLYSTFTLVLSYVIRLTESCSDCRHYWKAGYVSLFFAGYNNQLGYRSSDGAFAVFPGTPSGTWLTAYVAKVFLMASNIITIQEDVICNALKWLILNRQQPDGKFVENAPVRYIDTGDVSGQDTDASMTAFVLIAMQEGRRLCIEKISVSLSLKRSDILKLCMFHKNLDISVSCQIRLQSYGAGVEKAMGFLQSRKGSLTNPYAAAIVSYALANAGVPDKSLFARFISRDESHWPVRDNRPFTIEATAYALLTLVRMNEFEKAGRLVNWLRQNQDYRGYGSSTQPTIMVFQAVADYRLNGKDAPNLNLQVELWSEVTRHDNPVTFSFTGDSFRPRTEKFQLNEAITMTARGRGKATIIVEYLYYAEPKSEDLVCNNFILDVKLTPEPVVDPQAKASFLLTIDIQFNSSTVDASMAILDITQLTGFVVDETDLQRLRQGKDRPVQKLEKDQKLSDRGSLILYLNKVSHNQKDRIAFKVHRVMDVGLLQPAAVTVYEYYNSENRCVKFYHPEKVTGQLTRLCDPSNNICQCAEEICSKQRKTPDDTDTRGETACKTHIDYVMKGTIVRSENSATTDKYIIRVAKMIKSGTDGGMLEGRERVFIGHANCRESMDLQEGRSYLIMGAKQDVHQVKDGYQFVLGEQTWIEHWPTDQEAQDSKEVGDRLEGIQELVFDFETAGGCQY
ncbi:complement C3-like [Engraulis encrasicolus]|uniref:complement C3-like n=1 Tax=Engraulis encrasicolus TaxID=184585 RepID=UPI002FD41924